MEKPERGWMGSVWIWGAKKKRGEGGRSKSSRPRFCAINAYLFLPACVQYCKRWEGEDCKGLAICLMMQEELLGNFFRSGRQKGLGGRKKKGMDTLPANKKKLARWGRTRGGREGGKHLGGAWDPRGASRTDRRGEGKREIGS